MGEAQISKWKGEFLNSHLFSMPLHNSAIMKTKMRVSLCFSKPSSTSSRRDCHLTQSKLCFYLCVYSFSLSTSIQESCCNKILQNVQLWCITLKFVESLKTVCFPLSQSTYISRRPLSVPLCIQPCIALTLMIPPPKQKKNSVCLHL